MDKITKLSQAIRLGATFHPQCHRSFFLRNGFGEVFNSCALGAAWLALGYDPDRAADAFTELRERFNIPVMLLGEITVKNDTGLTRESIADWLEKKGL